MNSAIFYFAGIIAATPLLPAAAASPTLSPTNPFADIVNAAPPTASAPFAGLPEPPPATACFDFIQPSLLPLTPILLDRCTGATWMLVRHPLANAQGQVTGNVYRWDPIAVEKGEAVLGALNDGTTTAH